MLSSLHKKDKRHAAKSDPVKEILSRREAKQNQTGLSLYTNRNALEEILAPAIEQVRGTNTYSSPKKSTIPGFADLSAARQKIHKRLKGGTNVAGKQEYSKKRRGVVPFGSLEDSAGKDHVLNLTFPPAATRSFPIGDRSLNHSHNGFSGNTNSDLCSAELNLNPFGYTRRTRAFEPTQISYVVEWPKTWPLKIMSFQHRNHSEQRRDTRRKNMKLKVLQSSEREEESALEKLAREGDESDRLPKQSICKPSLPRLPQGRENGNRHMSPIGTRESNGERITEALKGRETTEAVRPRVSREVENRAASSSVAESTYVALQNADSTVQISKVDEELTKQPSHLISAPPSSPSFSSVIQKRNKEEEWIEEREELQENALNTQHST